jgi:hypothetical protein
MNADGFGTRVCGICARPCHVLDDWCSAACEREAERQTERSEADLVVAAAVVAAWSPLAFSRVDDTEGEW